MGCSLWTALRRKTEESALSPEHWAVAQDRSPPPWSPVYPAQELILPGQLLSPAVICGSRVRSSPQ